MGEGVRYGVTYAGNVVDEAKASNAAMLPCKRRRGAISIKSAPTSVGGATKLATVPCLDTMSSTAPPLSLKNGLDFQIRYCEHHASMHHFQRRHMPLYLDRKKKRSTAQALPLHALHHASYLTPQRRFSAYQRATPSEPPKPTQRPCHCLQASCDPAVHLASRQPFFSLIPTLNCFSVLLTGTAQRHAGEKALPRTAGSGM